MQALLATRQKDLDSGKRQQPKDFKAKKSGKTHPPRAKGGVKKANGKSAVAAAKAAKDKAIAQLDKSGLAAARTSSSTEPIVV